MKGPKIIYISLWSKQKRKKKLNYHPGSVWPSTYLLVPVYGTRYKQKKNQLGDATADDAKPEALVREQQQFQSSEMSRGGFH
jgi:hypothetical protein